jgi:hypothetical protein
VCVEIIQVLVDATGDGVAITPIMCLPSSPDAIQLAVKEEEEGI